MSDLINTLDIWFKDNQIVFDADELKSVTTALEVVQDAIELAEQRGGDL